MKKLGQALQDAYMTGNSEEIERIKKEIDEKQQSLRPRRDNVLRINTVLNDPKSSAIACYDFLNQAFGKDWWEWEWETIEQLLWIKYGVALDDVNRDKVQAIRHVCRSDGSFFDWYEFNQVALSFSGSIADFEIWRSPSPGMVINAINALNHIRPDRELSFGFEVVNYVCIVLINEGIYVPPPSIKSIIEDKMKEFVSADIQNAWPEIMKRYRKSLSTRRYDFQDTISDIQAKRLINAEAAAKVYS